MCGINRWAFNLSTFPQIFYCFLKDPSPLNHKNAFQRLNNSVCSYIESRSFCCKKHYSGRDIVQIVAIPGSSYPLSSSIPGGLFQNRNYEKKPYRGRQIAGRSLPKSVYNRRRYRMGPTATIIENLKFLG